MSITVQVECHDPVGLKYLNSLPNEKYVERFAALARALDRVSRETGVSIAVERNPGPGGTLRAADVQGWFAPKKRPEHSPFSDAWTPPASTRYPRVGAFEATVVRPRGRPVQEMLPGQFRLCSKLDTGKWPNVDVVCERLKNVLLAVVDRRCLQDTLEAYCWPYLQANERTAGRVLLAGYAGCYKAADVDRGIQKLREACECKKGTGDDGPETTHSPHGAHGPMIFGITTVRTSKRTGSYNPVKKTRPSSSRRALTNGDSTGESFASSFTSAPQQSRPQSALLSSSAGWIGSAASPEPAARPETPRRRPQAAVAALPGLPGRPARPQSATAAARPAARARAGAPAAVASGGYTPGRTLGFSTPTAARGGQPGSPAASSPPVAPAPRPAAPAAATDPEDASLTAIRVEQESTAGVSDRTLGLEEDAQVPSAPEPAPVAQAAPAAAAAPATVPSELAKPDGDGVAQTDARAPSAPEPAPVAQAAPASPPSAQAAPAAAAAPATVPSELAKPDARAPSAPEPAPVAQAAPASPPSAQAAPAAAAAPATVPSELAKPALPEVDELTARLIAKFGESARPSELFSRLPNLPPMEKPVDRDKFKASLYGLRVFTASPFNMNGLFDQLATGSPPECALATLLAAVEDRWPSTGAVPAGRGADPDDEYGEDEFEEDDRQAGGLPERAAAPPAAPPATAPEAPTPAPAEAAAPELAEAEPPAARPLAETPPRGQSVDGGYSDEEFEEPAPEILAAAPEAESSRSAREADVFVEDPPAQPTKPQSPSTNDSEAGYCGDFDDEEGEMEDLGSFDYAEDCVDEGADRGDYEYFESEDEDVLD